MQSFEWVDATTVEQAAQLAAESTSDAWVRPKAGGIDLLDLIKEGVIAPKRLINLKTIPNLADVKETAGGVTLGALVTLHTIDTDEKLRGKFPALADAAGHAATPQVRRAATIGGNLLQKTRCWYFRHDYFHEGETDLADRAKDGQNQYHAIFDNDKTAMVQASTPATALVAYDASVVLTDSAGKTRTVKVADFLLPPQTHTPVDAKLEPGEILTAVVIPNPPAGTRAAYHKQTERDSYDWPICDVAVVVQLDGGTVKAASIVTGWVAPLPRRASEAEAFLVGKPLNEANAREAARLAVKGATPLTKNAYKVPLLETSVRRTLLATVAV